MKRKWFLVAAVLPCLALSIAAFTTKEKEASNHPGVTDEFVSAYSDLTEACLDFTNGYEETPDDTAELKAVMYNKADQLQAIEDWQTQLNTAEESGFFGFPTFAYHNPYSVCIYTCTKQYINCYRQGANMDYNYPCESEQRTCFSGCKQTFLTGGAIAANSADSSPTATLVFEHYCTVTSPGSFESETDAALWVRSLRGIGYHVHSIDWGFSQGGVCCPDSWRPSVQVWTNSPCSTLTNDPLSSN